MGGATLYLYVAYGGLSRLLGLGSRCKGWLGYGDRAEVVYHLLSLVGGGLRGFPLGDDEGPVLSVLLLDVEVEVVPGHIGLPYLDGYGFCGV